MILGFLTIPLCCADTAHLPAKDGPAADQDSSGGHQEQRAADGLPSSGSPLSTDPGTREGDLGAQLSKVMRMLPEGF